MFNLQITKLLFWPKKTTLSEGDKTKLAVFISNFSMWNEQYKTCLTQPITYEQVEVLKQEIYNTLSEEGDSGEVMLVKALEQID